MRWVGWDQWRPSVHFGLMSWHCTESSACTPKLWCPFFEHVPRARDRETDCWKSVQAPSSPKAAEVYFCNYRVSFCTVVTYNPYRSVRFLTEEWAWPNLISCPQLYSSFKVNFWTNVADYISNKSHTHIPISVAEPVWTTDKIMQSGSCQSLFLQDEPGCRRKFPCVSFFF